MIKISQNDPNIAKVKAKSEESINNATTGNRPSFQPIETRPEVVDAKVYKLKSAFVKKEYYFSKEEIGWLQ